MRTFTAFSDATPGNVVDGQVACGPDATLLWGDWQLVDKNDNPVRIPDGKVAPDVQASYPGPTNNWVVKVWVPKDADTGNGIQLRVTARCSIS